MPLEDPEVLRKKNKKRLRNLFYITFINGITIEKPHSFKNPRWIIAAAIIVFSCIDTYGHVALGLLYEENVILSIESVSGLMQEMISTLKLTYILFVQDRFYKLIQTLRTNELIDQIKFLADETPYNKDLRKEAFKIMEDCWRITKLQFNTYMVPCIVIGIYYFFSAQVLNAYNWYIGNAGHRILLPSVSYFPFMAERIRHWPYYILMTFITGCANFNLGICSVSFDGMFMIIAMHCVALFRILKLMVAFTTSSQVPKHLRSQYLRECIMHYNRSYQYCKEFNDVFLHISLVQFVLSLGIIGTVIFEGFIGLNNNIPLFLKMISAITASGYELTVFCLNGQFIFNETDEISNAFYDCEWYNESKEFKELIKMIMQRTNRPFIMRVSWFSTMSLQTLMSIINTSVSYFLLLKNIIN